MEFDVIPLKNGCLSVLRFRPFHKSETTRLPGVTIRHEIYALHIYALRVSTGGECGIEVWLGGLVADIPDKNAGHSVDSLVANYLCRVALKPTCEGGETAPGTEAKTDTNAGNDKTSLAETGAYSVGAAIDGRKRRVAIV